MSGDEQHLDIPPDFTGVQLCADQHGLTDCLGLVRLGASWTRLVLLAKEPVLVRLHCPSQRGVQGHVRCNGEGCVWCRVGEGLQERLLLPVYLPSAERVAVLACTPSRRPGTLWPKIECHLRKEGEFTLLVRRMDRFAYEVQSEPASSSGLDGKARLTAFMARYRSGEVDLAHVYPQFANDVLDLPAVGEMVGNSDRGDRLAHR